VPTPSTVAMTWTLTTPHLSTVKSASAQIVLRRPQFESRFGLLPARLRKGEQEQGGQ
jgi:hypothetical protein